MPWYSSVHRGSGYKSRLATAAYEGARGAVAEFVGARDGTVVLVRNTTEAINVLAAALPAGTPRALDRRRAPREHAAVAPPRRDRAAGPGQRMRSSSSAASTRCGSRGRGSTCSPSPAPRTSPARCGRWPSSPRSRTTTERELFVDAAQLAPHRAIDMAGMGIDYLALSGHKLYAPFGAGALVACGARPRARRAAAARRRGDRARHARRRRVGRRARALRGGLAQRGGRGRAGRGVPDPRPARDGTASRRTSAASPRAWRPAWPACPGLRTAGAVGRRDRRPRRPGDLRARRATATRSLAAILSAEHAHRRAPRLLLRAPAAGAPARRARPATSTACARRSAPAGGPRCPEPCGRASGSGPRRRTSTAWSTPWPRSRAAGRAGATCATARTTSTARHPTCARCRGRRATSRRPPVRRRGR